MFPEPPSTWKIVSLDSPPVAWPATSSPRISSQPDARDIPSSVYQKTFDGDESDGR